MVILPANGCSDAKRQGGTNCIITCHNYGRYLRQCIQSCLDQSRPFANIIVVDDDSNDDTADIARSFAEVRYLRVNHHNFSTARNAGYESLPESEFCLFVDADNWIEPDFHERLLSGMTHNKTAVVYGAIRIHKDGCDPYFSSSVRDFSPAFIEHKNTADACSLIRCLAFHQAGQWGTSKGFMTDWGLWIRLLRLGWSMKHEPRAVLNYRVHDQQMSNERHKAPPHVFVASIRNHALIAVVTLFSGRRWALRHYARFLQAIEWNRSNLFIVALDNSAEDAFNGELNDMLRRSGFHHSVIRFDERAIPSTTASEFAGNGHLRHHHNRPLGIHMAKLYATARQYVPAGASYVWSVEDDIEPPPDALTHLIYGVHERQDSGLVAGVAQSRFCKQIIAWDHGKAPPPPPWDTFVEVTETGFYCALFPRAAWESLSFRAAEGVPDGNIAYDHAACRDLRAQGMKVYLAGSVRCKHWQPNGTALEPHEEKT